jgi:hypothetical protein
VKATRVEYEKDRTRCATPIHFLRAVVLRFFGFVMGERDVCGRSGAFGWFTLTERELALTARVLARCQFVDAA